MGIEPIHPKFLPGIRWAMIRTCRVGGHLGATEVMIREVVGADYMSADRTFIRDQLHYLEQRDLVEIERSEVDPWRVTLTRYGYDVADYQVDCHSGIRRPPRLNPDLD